MGHVYGASHLWNPQGPHMPVRPYPGIIETTGALRCLDYPRRTSTTPAHAPVPAASSSSLSPDAAMAVWRPVTGRRGRRPLARRAMYKYIHDRTCA